MAHWNHRIMRHGDGDDVTYFMHEVFYEDDGGISWTKDPCGIGSDDPSFAETLERLRLATLKPVLDYATGKEIT